MKRGWMATIGTFGILLLAGGSFAADKKVELKETKDRVSYSIGLSLGENFKRDGIDVNVELLSQAIRDVMKGSTPLMNQKEVQETLVAFKQEMVAKQEAKTKELGAKNLKDGEAFLAANAKKDGVVTLPSGLQYKVLEKGNGKKPVKTDKVTVDYKGTLIDGTVFDSSYDRGQPATFGVGDVIAGWTEALQLMPEGAKWQLFIPSKLAYGERGAGQAIGPNTALIFEVVLKKIN